MAYIRDYGSPRASNTFEGLPGVLGNKGTLAKYRREQGNISQFLGTGEQNSKYYSTKTFGKCVGTWEHRAILEGNKGTRTPLGDPQLCISGIFAAHMQITSKVKPQYRLCCFYFEDFINLVEQLTCRSTDV